MIGNIFNDPSQFRIDWRQLYYTNGINFRHFWSSPLVQSSVPLSVLAFVTGVSN